MASQANIPKLYRDILKAAKRFPSIKRNKILEEIKVEFHANKVSLAVCNALPIVFAAQQVGLAACLVLTYLYLVCLPHAKICISDNSSQLLISVDSTIAQA